MIHFQGFRKSRGTGIAKHIARPIERGHGVIWTELAGGAGCG